MTKQSFNIYADAAEIRVEVTPTMEALGDQPWRVHLYDLSDGLLLNEEAIIAEAGCAHDAAVSVARNWMASQGLPTEIYKIVRINNR